MRYKRVVFAVAILLCACTKAPETSLPLPDPSLLDNSEEVAKQSLIDDSAKLLAAKDYDGLEKLAATDRVATSPLGSGVMPIMLFYDGITSLSGPETVAAYQEKETALKDWWQTSPDSVEARIALAMVLTDDAWFARGSGYANTVSDSAWVIFGQKLDQAAERLDGVKDKRQDYPEWYAAHNPIGMGLSEDKAAYLATALEGTTHYPQANDVYCGVEAFLLPRWFGSNQEVHDYITQSADKVGGDEGDILYARLAKNIWSYSYDINPFTETGLSWPRVKHGMELICNRYPHSTTMANYFCVFAYQAQDHAVAQTLFNYLGDRYESWAWGSRENFDTARNWAK
jgi:hypothetical protein